MAQDPILGKAIVERALECVDVVDSLTDERTLAEHILVNVGHGTRIGIDARVSAVQSRVP